MAKANAVAGIEPKCRRIADEMGYELVDVALEKEPTWNLFAITADKSIEEALGRKADRRRKLYNGNIETTYYQFHGEKGR